MESLELAKGSEATVVYDVEHGMTLEPMKGKRASSRVDLVYTELCPIPEVTSVSFQTSDSVLGNSLEFHQSNQGSIII